MAAIYKLSHDFLFMIQYTGYAGEVRPEKQSNLTAGHMMPAGWVCNLPPAHLPPPPSPPTPLFHMNA